MFWSLVGPTKLLVTFLASSGAIAVGWYTVVSFICPVIGLNHNVFGSFLVNMT